MAKKKQDQYFDTFVEMSTYSCNAAKLLREILGDYDPRKLEDYMKKMHEIEHQGDSARHDMIGFLAKEFITPIEREDIMAMSESIDTVTDKIEDVLQRMYMYNILTVRDEAFKLTDTIIECTTTVKNALEEFHNFKKSKTLNDMIIEVNRLEDVGDILYIEATRNVYSDPDIAPLEAFSWAHIFHYMEGVFDACEDVADVIEGTVMKNT